MKKIKIGIVGTGISGLSAAYHLSRKVKDESIYECQFTFLEKETRIGGHTFPFRVDSSLEGERSRPIDIGFQVFNDRNYPELSAWFQELGVKTCPSDMSFSVFDELDSSLNFGTKGFQIKPLFLFKLQRLLNQMSCYLSDCLLDEKKRHYTLEKFVQEYGCDPHISRQYLYSFASAVWSSSPSSSGEGSLHYQAYTIIQFMRNHGFLSLFSPNQWLTLKNSSQDYLDRVRELLGEQTTFHTGVTVELTKKDATVRIKETGEEMTFDYLIVAAHLPSLEEQGISFHTTDVYVHSDPSLMPPSRQFWSSWNVIRPKEGVPYTTYWENSLQPIGSSVVFVSLNPPFIPSSSTHFQMRHPNFTPQTLQAIKELKKKQGEKKTFYAGAYLGYGFHEDGFRSGRLAAEGVFNQICLQGSKKEGTRSSEFIDEEDYYLKTSSPSFNIFDYFFSFFSYFFLSLFFLRGGLVLSETWHRIRSIRIYGSSSSVSKQLSKRKLRLGLPVFYLLDPSAWRPIFLRGDIGVGETYFRHQWDTNDLVRLLKILILNNNISPFFHRLQSLTTGAYQKLLRKRANTITQNKQNIKEHYDLGNDLYCLFLDESMTYSSGLFEGLNLESLEERKDLLALSQKRKRERIIQELDLENDQPLSILEIGSGWGALALDLARSGHQVLSITLSEEQKKYVDQLLEKEPLEVQERLKVKICDYRSLDPTVTFDRIVSVEMIEAVGMKYLPSYTEVLRTRLKPYGRIVLQMIHQPHERIKDQESPDFINTYIFPGGFLPSIEMLESSQLQIREVYDMTQSYVYTLAIWRERFKASRSEIEKRYGKEFYRKWIFYFASCQAAFDVRHIYVSQLTITHPSSNSPSS